MLKVSHIIFYYYPPIQYFNPFRSAVSHFRVTDHFETSSRNDLKDTRQSLNGGGVLNLKGHCTNYYNCKGLDYMCSIFCFCITG